MSTSLQAPLALVTGGSGYFGTVLVEALRKHGHRVRVLDINDTPDRPSDVEFVRGDIRDPAAVGAACQGVQVVHHNVAQVPLAKDRHLFETVNVGGTRVLLQACLRHRVPKVVHVSSSAVFGVPVRNPVDATVEPHPREPYGAAKLRAEQLVHQFVSDGLDVTIVRPRTILGHGRLGIFQILFELVRLGRPLYVLGSGRNRYQFVHAQDLARACIAAGELAGPQVFNIGTDRFGSMRELLEGLVKHAGTASTVRSLPMRPATAAMRFTSALGLSPLGPYHALMYGREMFFDIAPAIERLHWRPEFSNAQMIAESYDYYCANRDAIFARVGASHHRSATRMGILALLKYLP